MDITNMEAQSQALRRGSMRTNLSQANLFHPISFRGTEMFQIDEAITETYEED